MTITEAFERLKRKYEPTSSTKETVSTKQQYLRNSLTNNIHIIDDFLTGSYVKQTQIRPHTDIDIFFILHPAYRDELILKTPQNVLLYVMRNLRKTYPKTIMRSDGQAITLTFQDKFRFDVVPAFEEGRSYYIIPNRTTQSWIKCNPKIHIKALSDLNKKMDMTLKPVIKMIKCWRAVNKVRLTSFHIELLAIKCFGNVSSNIRNKSINSYPYALAYFFHQACSLIYEPMYDETNERLDQYLIKPIRANTWRKFFVATQKATEACFYENINMHPPAIARWRSIFGSYFT